MIQKPDTDILLIKWKGYIFLWYIDDDDDDDDDDSQNYYFFKPLHKLVTINIGNEYVTT